MRWLTPGMGSRDGIQEGDRFGFPLHAISDFLAKMADCRVEIVAIVAIGEIVEGGQVLAEQESVVGTQVAGEGLGQLVVLGAQLPPSQ